MLTAFARAFRTPDLRRKLLFTLFMIALFRLGSHIPTPGVSYEAVTASRGKFVRAEPIAALYEMGKVHHVGAFAALEDQLCEWSQGSASPDRLDGLVWALTALDLGGGSTRPSWEDVL